MKSVEYWKRRAEARMYEELEKSEKTAGLISKVYAKAAAYLMDKAEHVFDRFKITECLTKEEALSLIGSLSNVEDTEELIRKLEADGSEEALETLKRLRNTGAYGSRIQRLGEMLKQVNKIMTSVYGQELKEVTGVLSEIASDSYLKTIYDLQQRINTGFSVAHIDQKRIDKILRMNWSGEHFSKRIWNNTQKLGQTVKEQILEGALTGKTEREMADVIAQEFGKGSGVARRLVRTESCHVASEVNAEAYEDAEVEMYLYLATLDLRTSEVCRALDGKRFPVSDRQVGENYPPMHPWCRSTTIAIVDEEYLQTMKRTYRDPETGKNEKVPLTMSYDEWYKKYVDKEPEESNTDPDDLTERRKQRLAERNKKKQSRAILSEPESHAVINRFGEEIEISEKLSEETRGIIERLSGEYDTRLRKVVTGSDKSAGSVDLGGTMHLSSKNGEIPIHEFAHTLTSEYGTKIGVYEDKEFWKEIKKVQRQYMKDVGDDTSRWISSYEHGSRKADEFFAEAFTHAKMREWGMDIPDHYGKDFTYSQKVLDITDKYFGKISEDDKIDWMSNSLNPRYGNPVKRNNENGEFELRKVTNSKFNIYAEKGIDGKHFAVTNTHKALRHIERELPDYVTIPDVYVVDFSKRKGWDAGGGYDNSTGILYINSNIDSKEKLNEFLKANKGWFSSVEDDSIIYHEMGHKLYYCLIEAIEKQSGKGYNKAMYMVDNMIQEIVGREDLNKKISRYASDKYALGDISDVVAESMKVRKTNELAGKLLDTLEGLIHEKSD